MSKNNEKPDIAVTEIFNSISGEVNPYGQGIFTTFLRLAGCSANCWYCDTKDADSVEYLSMEDIFSKVIPFLRKTKVLCITGGEPFESNLNFRLFLKLFKLAKSNNLIYIETNGLHSIHRYQYRKEANALLQDQLFFVMDYKLDKGFHRENLDYLLPQDILKFVVWNTESLDRAINRIKEFKYMYGNNFCSMAISPVIEHKEKFEVSFSPKLILEKLEQEELAGVYLNMQVHKLCGLR